MFLLSFTAEVEGDAILPAWEAAHEVDTLGFNLNRADSPDGAQAKLSGALITGQAMPGSTCGAACQWLDQWQLNPGQPYCNWLEDLDIHGEAMLHRPVQAIAGTAVSSLWAYLLLVGQPPSGVEGRKTKARRTSSATRPGAQPMMSQPPL